MQGARIVTPLGPAPDRDERRQREDDMNEYAGADRGACEAQCGPQTLALRPERGLGEHDHRERQGRIGEGLERPDRRDSDQQDHQEPRGLRESWEAQRHGSCDKDEHRHAESDCSVLKQPTDWIYEPQDEDDDRHGESAHGQRPAHAGDPDDEVGACEDQPVEQSVQESQRPVAGTGDREPTSDEVDRANAVLGERVNEHGAAAEDVTGRPEEEILVELNDRGQKGIRGNLRTDDHEVGDREEHEYERDDVGSESPAAQLRGIEPDVGDQGRTREGGGEQQDDDGHRIQKGERGPRDHQQHRGKPPDLPRVGADALEQPHADAPRDRRCEAADRDPPDRDDN